MVSAFWTGHAGVAAARVPLQGARALLESEGVVAVGCALWNGHAGAVEGVLLS